MLRSLFGLRGGLVRPENADSDWIILDSCCGRAGNQYPEILSLAT